MKRWRAAGDRLRSSQETLVTAWNAERSSDDLDNDQTDELPVLLETVVLDDAVEACSACDPR